MGKCQGRIWCKSSVQGPYILKYNIVIENWQCGFLHLKWHWGSFYSLPRLGSFKKDLIIYQRNKMSKHFPFQINFSYHSVCYNICKGCIVTDNINLCSLDKHICSQLSGTVRALYIYGKNGIKGIQIKGEGIEKRKTGKLKKRQQENDNSDFEYRPAFTMRRLTTKPHFSWQVWGLNIFFLTVNH